MKHLAWLLVFAPVILAADEQQPKDDRLETAPLEELLDLRVQTATLRKQSLQNAPASVSVITAEDIRRYGYRTLAEALANTRSFYVTSDGPFQFAGARGFSLLGDYNTRFLVLINGHHLTDNVYAAMYYFGQDFPLDLDLVEQIEIVRGPSSALYGSNGLFATVNIITRTPRGSARARGGVEMASFGEQKLTMSTSFGMGRDGHVLLSASALHTAGRSVELPMPADESLTPRRVDHAGNQIGQHLFAEAVWRNWAFAALLGWRKAIVPTGWYNSGIGDSGTSDTESRSFFEAAWNHSVGQDGAIRWRTYYDWYRYDGVYAYSEGVRGFDGALGDWMGSQLVYHHDASRLGRLTLGGEVKADLRNIQYSFAEGPSEERYDSIRRAHRNTGYGLFAQHEFRISPAWTSYIGGRIDQATSDALSLSPRVAVVHRHRRGSDKVMYGRAFRNPSSFERHWEPNPSLGAERIDTIEVAREQNLHRRANLVASAFHYRLADLIVGVPVGVDRLQYRNASRAGATGLEVEVNSEPAAWLQTVASFSLQRTRCGNSGIRLQNSPVRLGQFRAAAPLLRHRLMVGGAVRYIGSRLGADSSSVPAATLADVTFTAPRSFQGLAFQFGIRNLFNRAYADPLSPEHATLLLPGAGRSVYLRMTWRHE